MKKIWILIPSSVSTTYCLRFVEVNYSFAAGLQVTVTTNGLVIYPYVGWIKVAYH